MLWRILTQLINDGYPVDALYLYFKEKKEKAFDTVPHQRLMCKLVFLGKTGNVYSWTEDF